MKNFVWMIIIIICEEVREFHECKMDMKSQTQRRRAGKRVNKYVCRFFDLVRRERIWSTVNYRWDAC